MLREANEAHLQRRPRGSEIAAAGRSGGRMLSSPAPTSIREQASTRMIWKGSVSCSQANRWTSLQVRANPPNPASRELDEPTGAARRGRGQRKTPRKGGRVGRWPCLLPFSNPLPDPIIAPPAALWSAGRGGA